MSVGRPTIRSVSDREYETVAAGDLAVAYLDEGPRHGWPVVLTHGFPFDVHAYDEVVGSLTAAGARVIRPWLRGHGPTRFLHLDTPRSGQQAARGADLLALLDALGLDTAVLGGFDWGGNASCVVAALWPERVAGLVSLASYDVLDVAGGRTPGSPAAEHALWYQHLFQTDRGRAVLEGSRCELCRMLWRQWSPDWDFGDDLFERTAAAFDNPDFVDVVVHAYRHDFGTSTGDPALADLEARLARRPAIVVPAVTLDGSSDTLKPGGTADHAAMFTARHEHRVVDAGHALPYEAPAAFADAVLTVHGWAG